MREISSNGIPDGTYILNHKTGDYPEFEDVHVVSYIQVVDGKINLVNLSWMVIFGEEKR